eukprot:scaffold38985_cov53-Phaeocystis_antarctica.AAC.2
MRTGQDRCHPGDLPEDVAWLGPVEENDLRIGHEVESLGDLHDPHSVIIALGVKVEFLARWHCHDSGPLVHTTRQRDAADEPSTKLHGVRVWASRSVNVCSLHVRDGLRHHGWRGDGVVGRVESATDQRGGRELTSGIKRTPKAGHGRPSDGAGADVAGHRGHAGSGNAGFCQKYEPLRGADVNSRQGVGGRVGQEDHQDAEEHLQLEQRREQQGQPGTWQAGGGCVEGAE